MNQSSFFIQLCKLAIVFFDAAHGLVDFPIVGKCFRIKLAGNVYHSTSYTRALKTNSCVVAYLDSKVKHYGVIQHFIVSQCQTIYAVMRRIYVINSSIAECVVEAVNEDLCRAYSISDCGSYFKKILIENDILVCKVDSLVGKCILINLKDDMFLTELTHIFEHN